MLPDPVSNPGHLTYESGALPIALRGPAHIPGLTVNIPRRLLNVSFILGELLTGL